MALPTDTEIKTLDFVYLGAPFLQVEAKNLNTGSLDIVYLGMPFVAQPFAGGTPPEPPAFNAAQFFIMF
jgi:hypothetical protein